MQKTSIFRALYVFASLCVCASAGAQSQAPQSSVELDTFLQGLQTLQADFRQTVRDGEGRIVEQSSGVLAIHRPNRFRWHYTEPNEQIIVADGKRLWLYDVDLEQVTERSMEQSLSGTPAALLSGGEDIRNSFNVDQVERQGKVSVVTLVPQRDDTDFKSVLIGFSGKVIDFMQLNDKLGQSTLLEFSKVRRNSPVDDKRFVFVPPPGVDVIGTTGAGPTP